MTALLARRDDRCLSDLTMDRFLLGETSDSDEGRMLERHLAWCSTCLARVQSLRALYSHADMPEATDQPAPVPPEGQPAEQRPDVATGVLEVILLRDGLLIGTEVFTPGAWVVGSSPRAHLVLDAAGVAGEHARFLFRNGNVVVERAQGPVLVNGYRVERSEVRPIDEVIIGPFVVRSRVITGRWTDAAQPTRRMRALPREVEPEDAPAAPEQATQLITVPTAAAAVLAQGLSLRLDLFWGDTLQASELVSGNVPSSAFPAFAPAREPSASAVAEGYRLRMPGARLEVLQGTQWVAVGDELVLTTGTRARVVEGALRLEARLQVAPARVMPAPATTMLRGAFVPVLSFLMLSLLTFAGVASTLSDEDRFDSRPAPKLSVYMVPPPVKVKLEPTREPSSAPPRADTVKPTRRTPPTAGSVKTPPPHLSGLAGLNRVMDVVNKLSRTNLPSVRGRGAKQDLFAGLGKACADCAGLGISPVNGLGAEGLRRKGGVMHTGRIGTSDIGGQLVGPIIRDRGVVSGIDREAVAKVINQHMSEVMACYERALAGTASVSGKLTFEWVIGTSGAVTSVKIKSATLADPSVASCVSARIESWSFPRPRGGAVTVSYPFIFEAVGF